MDMLWAPGQSDAAREILRHLTRREKVGLASLSLMLGVFAFAAPMVVMVSATGTAPFHEYVGGLALPIFIALAAGIAIIFALRRRLLLGSRAAKDNGYTMAEINARRPLSRSDKLALVGLALLSVSLMLAGA